MPNIREAILIVLEESLKPVLRYRTITCVIERRWPGIFDGDTPWQSVNPELWRLVRAGVVQTCGSGSGRFYLRSREHEVGRTQPKQLMMSMV